MHVQLVPRAEVDLTVLFSTSRGSTAQRIIDCNAKNSRNPLIFDRFLSPARLLRLDESARVDSFSTPNPARLIMVRLNPDPHTRKYVYVPKGAVTAFFGPGQDYDVALKALADAGFGDDRIDVYSGEEGAEKLDAEGRHHGLWVRFVRSVEDTFTDDAYLSHRTDEILRDGGTVIAVFTHGKRDERDRVVEILRQNGGSEPVYWGRWVTETF